MIKYVYISILILLSVIFKSHAQDVEYSQFYANSLYLNPALAGAKFKHELSMSYRNQWPENKQPYVTYSVAYDQFVDVVNGGVGIHVMQDNQGQGALLSTSVSGIYSHAVNVTSNFALRAGFKATFFQRKIDWTNFVFSDQIDPVYGVKYPTNEISVNQYSKSYLDFSFGLMGVYKKFFVGAVIDHLGEPEQSFLNDDSFSKLPQKISLHAGAKIPLDNYTGLRVSRISVSPNILYQRQQGFEQVNYGLYLSKEEWVIGAWMRQNLSFDYDSFIILLGYSNENFKIGYSFDYVVSNLIHTNTGAHEISISLFLGSKKTKCDGDIFYRKKKRYRAVHTPQF